MTSSAPDRHPTRRSLVACRALDALERGLPHTRPLRMCPSSAPGAAPWGAGGSGTARPHLPTLPGCGRAPQHPRLGRDRSGQAAGTTGNTTRRGGR